MPCSVREYCSLKHCEDPKSDMYIGEHNCTCKGCIERSIRDDNSITPKKAKEMCEFSGEAYNTDGDCLASK